MEELGPGGSCGVHSWIEDASGDGRRVSWFAPQNQGGGRRLKTPSRGGTGVGIGTDGGDGRRWHLGPRYGRGGDRRRAASRAVRRPKRERRLGPRRGGGNLPACEVLAVFSKPATYSDFADPPKPWTGTSSTWRHRIKDFESKKGAPPSIESVQRAAADPTSLTGPLGRSDRSGRSSRVYKPPLFQVEGFESLESFSVFPFPFPLLRLGPRSPTQREFRL